MFMMNDMNEERPGATRRTALRGLGLAVGGAALATGLGASPAAADPRRGPTTFVLVHGTHSAGAFWMPIARELTLRGHRVVMVDQPGHGAEAFVPESYQRQDLEAMAVEPSPLKGLDLDDYEARVTGIVRRAARHGPVVLVGHSLGGVSVSRVADAVPHLLHHICYMAAFCPSRVLPTADACTAAPENANAVSPVELMVGDADRLGALRLNFRTGRSHDLALLKEMICADYPDAAFRRTLADMQTDEPIAAYAGRAVGRAESWGRVPRTYLRFGKDRTIATALQDRMIAEADAATPGNRFRVRDFPKASHVGPLDPAPVADALDSLAGRG
ncbi:alpha/beta hydrolase [Streptomyces kanamyceticus]|uniref:Alpha/beta fold hydrolase n=1 Tax=Streptomyces kanamyceticus TaxID=1967 RepID=A0A5J6GQQ3_STRKN|nr:alpha/beta fold hydrolase [Streptomyces kanamyceticus]QEU97769.1 alpha/beta fold hydrolase [Streptomyces kanamyceticus]